MANQLDHIFSALADPTRRAVVERLSIGAAPVSELHAPHDMALPTFMRHLKVLEDCGLTQSQKKGRVRTVHIEAAPLTEMQDWLSRYRAMWEGRLDRLAQLAETLEANSDKGAPNA